MAVKEGWYTKRGSKWQTMPDLMGRYRAAAFFGRIYAPHILNGLQTQDELQDTESLPQGAKSEDYEVEVVDEEKPSERPKGVNAALKATKAKQKTAKTSENTKQKELPQEKSSEETKQSPLPQTESKTKKNDGRQKDPVTQQNAPEQTTSQKLSEAPVSNGRKNVAKSSSLQNEAIASTQQSNDDIFGLPDDDYNPE